MTALSAFCYIIAGVAAVLLFTICMIALFKIITKDFDGYDY